MVLGQQRATFGEGADAALEVFGHAATAGLGAPRLIFGDAAQEGVEAAVVRAAGPRPALQQHAGLLQGPLEGAVVVDRLDVGVGAGRIGPEVASSSLGVELMA